MALGVVRAGAARFGYMNMASVVLVIVTAVRMFVFCLSHPIAGYANDYDFLRQSSCMGVWQVYNDRGKADAHPGSPVDALVFDGDRRSGLCLHSSDNLFPWLAAHLSGKGAHFALRRVGALKVLTAVALFVGVIAQPMSPALRLALATFAALVYGDFAVMLFFNTLYLEGSFLIFVVAGTSLTILAYSRSRHPRLGFILFFLGSIAWLCFARQQYWPFGAMVGWTGAAGFLLRWRDGRAALLVAGAIVAIQGGYAAVQMKPSQHTQQVIKANIADTFLGAVLPAARDKQSALVWLGLPPSCAASIGENWYSPGFQEHNLCPDIFKTRRLDLLGLFVRDPATFFVPMQNVIPASHPIILPAIGHFEQPSDQERKVYRWIRETSASSLLDFLSGTNYRNLVIASCFLSIPALGITIWRSIRLRERCGDVITTAMLLCGLGGALTAYAVVSSVFGDGYFDVPRHAIGILVGVDMQASSAMLIVGSVLQGYGESRQRATV